MNLVWNLKHFRMLLQMFSQKVWIAFIAYVFLRFFQV